MGLFDWFRRRSFVPPEPPGLMPIRVQSFRGDVVEAKALRWAEKRPFATVSFPEPIFIPYDRRTSDGYWSQTQTFYTRGPYAGMIMVWGQGEEFPRDTWIIHPGDMPLLAFV